MGSEKRWPKAPWCNKRLLVITLSNIHYYLNMTLFTVSVSLTLHHFLLVGSPSVLCNEFYVVCSKSIANFEFPRVTYIRFSIFLWRYVGTYIPHLYRQIRPLWMFSWFLIAILLGRVLARLRFLPLQFREQEKVTGKQIWWIRWLRQHYWPKIRIQASMCEHERCRGAKANFCSSTNPGVSGELLRANCA